MVLVYFYEFGIWPILFLLGLLLGCLMPRRGKFADTLSCGFLERRRTMNCCEWIIVIALWAIGIIFAVPLGYACGSALRKSSYDGLEAF